MAKENKSNDTPKRAPEIKIERLNESWDQRRSRNDGSSRSNGDRQGYQPTRNVTSDPPGTKKGESEDNKN